MLQLLRMLIFVPFLRYECTGCFEGKALARRVDKYCDGTTFIAQDKIEGIAECQERCSLPTENCTPEDPKYLAYYCEGNIAVYKHIDSSCQIQFESVECMGERNQVCRLGDCVDE